MRIKVASSRRKQTDAHVYIKTKSHTFACIKVISFITALKFVLIVPINISEPLID